MWRKRICSLSLQIGKIGHTQVSHVSTGGVGKIRGTTSAAASGIAGELLRSKASGSSASSSGRQPVAASSAAAFVRTSGGGVEAVQQQGMGQQQPGGGISSTKIKESLKTANLAFNQGVSSLNENYEGIFKPEDEKAKRFEAKKMIARKKMLTFRYVDSSLDRVELKRDLFLFANLVYGTDYIVDFILERELIYNVHQSMAELGAGGGNGENTKLFRGLPFLHPQGKAFPSLTASNMAQLAGEALPFRGGEEEEEEISSRGSAKSSSARGGQEGNSGKVISYDSSEDKKTKFSPSFFHKNGPHVVLLAPLVAGNGCDNTGQWSALFDKYKSQQTKLGGGGGSNSTSSTIITLRSIDSSADYFMRSSLVKRYREGLSANKRRESYVGHQLVRAFTDTFDLRNFTTTYCFIVDHKGFVRWMSQGPIQDIEEAENFQKALKKVEAESHRQSTLAAGKK